MKEKQDRLERLFKLVFNNIVLSKLIFHHSRLYSKNEFVIFKERAKLLEYKEREYIRSLEYWGEMLEIGDLPVGGVLKNVSLSYYKLSTIKGNIIPYGVEFLEFSYNVATSFSELPPTVHTVTNVVILNNEYPIIPPNITSISFSECPSISTKGSSSIFPNSIKEIEFDNSWDNEGMKLRKGDIPDSVTRLLLGDYKVKNLNYSERILPNSIIELEIECTNDEIDDNDSSEDKNLKYSNGLFNFIQPLNKLEILSIYTNSYITKESNLNQCNSIKVLSIYGNGGSNEYLENSVKEYSLPHSITKLKLTNISNKISANIIPNSVLSLVIDRVEIDELPPSLTYLKLYEKPVHYYTYEESLKLISILPESLTKLTVPNSFEHFKFTYPSNIKKIKYR